MSRLDELIKELCPDGVEYKAIEELTEYEQPARYIVESTKYDDSYDIPVLTAGQTFILGYTNETDGIYYASKKSPVIIFDDFTAAFKWVDFPFKVKSSAMKIVTANEKLTSIRYLYHMMGVINYTSDEHKRLWISKYSQIQIPIPPLPVQEEIVRILDKFTDYVTELQAELQARKQQYEYYREKLLHLEGARIPIRDLFETRNGFTPSKANSEFWENGTLPWFKLDDINDKGRVLSESYLHITQKALKKSGLFPENSIIISTSATIGEYALITVPFLCNQRFTCMTVKPRYKDKINIKYLMHYCPILSKYCKEHLNQGNFASVDMKQFGLFEFVIPSLDEQHKVVSILDKYETICNDITSGLPAEIEARQKQYEYYRDKILSFKEKEA